MTWIEASLLSALFLGVYDLCVKHAIRNNAVLPVLFWSTLTGATVWTSLLLVQVAHPGLLPASLVTDPLTPGQHLQLLLKSVIVTSSWIFTYFGLKHLPSVARFTHPRDDAALDVGRRAADSGRAPGRDAVARCHHDTGGVLRSLASRAGWRACIFTGTNGFGF